MKRYKGGRITEGLLYYIHAHASKAYLRIYASHLIFDYIVYLCIVLVSCIVSLYLWGARLQAQPPVQPLSLTKIDKNK